MEIKLEYPNKIHGFGISIVCDVNKEDIAMSIVRGILRDGKDLGAFLQGNTGNWKFVEFLGCKDQDKILDFVINTRLKID